MMDMLRINFNVAGVTFEGRQEIIGWLIGNEPVQITPEPDNKYDKNALAILVAFQGEIYHIGYVPKESAAKIAPAIDGEALSGKLLQITGGFVKHDGERASWGVIVTTDIPYMSDFDARKR